MVAVGMRVSPHPPHRSRRAALPHRAPASGNDAIADYFAALRTRSSARVTLLRHRVRYVFCSNRFPLANSLPSIASAGSLEPLFGDFLGSTELSDFPCSFITGVRP